MKKSLIALAALATVATAAQAQSSVTVYGVLDAGVATMDKANNKVAGTGGSWTGMANGGLSTSRFGFAGSEDLGGGLKAEFKLESQLFASNGAAGMEPNKGTNTYSGTVNQSTLFSREATVGLSGSFGGFKLGRANTVAYDNAVAIDPMGYGNFGAVGSFSPAPISRANNQIKYTSPSFQGLKANLAYSAAGVAGDESAGTTQEAGLVYDAHGLKVIASYFSNKTLCGAGVAAGTAAYNDNYCATYGTTNSDTANKRTTGLAGSNGFEQYLVGANYTVNQFDFTAAYTTKKNKNGVTGANAFGAGRVDLYILGAGYAINPASKLTLAYYSQEDRSLSATKAKSNMYAAQYKYALSKRTDVYAIGAVMDNAAATSLTVGDNANIFVSGNSSDASKPAAGGTQTGYMVGIRHKF